MVVFFIFFFTLFSCQFHPSTAQTWVKSGYWYAGSDFPISDINSALFTHLICGFANVNSSTFELSISSNFHNNFSIFKTIVKSKNPSIISLFSIWNGQPQTYRSILGEKANDSVLSSMITQSWRRRSFIDSSIKTARLYGFEGIDFFWVWLNSTDLSNLGVLLDEWRAAIASEPRNHSVSQLILTMAVRYSPSREIVTYPIESMKRNLDWAHIVAFDYHMPSRENFTGNHAALYSNSNKSGNISTDFGITQWFSQGFPAAKLVLGLPYHGYAWSLVNPSDISVGAPASGPAVTLDGSMGYRLIRSFIQNYGYGAQPVYNSTYVVNYFVVGSTWINFDGVETIKAKISYAKEKRLLGYNVFQVTNDDNWALSLAAQDREDKESNDHGILLKVLLPIASIIGLFASITYCYKSRVFKQRANVLSNARRSDPEKDSSAILEFGSNAPNLPTFSLSTIQAATNNFSSENKLGEGGFGPVYKGKLRGGQEIAVKRLSATSTQGHEEFKNEVSLTARLQHVNLVRLVGFCTEQEEKLLIYEYMPNGSLNLYLFDPIRRYSLDWTKRVRIIEGITQGLLYLQEYSNVTIIHRDIKASNILLDDEFNPKIADFGMARLFRKDVHEANTRRIVGTYGYIPPEYARKGIYSMKYDVYSFGVLLLQIISGKRNTFYYGTNNNLNLLEYAYESWKEDKGVEFFDESLNDSSSPCKLMTCIQVALLCVQENPDDRPTMLEVFSMLKNDINPIPIPKMPAFSKQKGEDADVQTGSSSHQEICSFNDSQISQLEPR
ncbi:hypothetical protein JCGZ_11003 [Jatropha curcas]|uniref:non-specific serine/threonine protein kinase n=1 Tax=Jatropha curcas TaxID=180498 RepID=A0A067KTC6_JATCU|nr:hypothetical protein JCGZ_11003 [Jatropha curcas]